MGKPKAEALDSKRTPLAGTMIKADEYHRLKQRDRQVLRLEDFTEDDLKAILAVEPSAAAAFDHEVNG
ncbi:hypothetical protein [Candidatus Thiodictyon syntrophicum]|jgi:hypothetical protein|uniref:hypothetical protein n=1 Tax=Candidatus Thiodictyon syntrophicum TaxID=1166950 RepID=UPI0012FE657D|nr:hypothetical protein [Candidatus Thiodictyon syntrophicum]